MSVQPAIYIGNPATPAGLASVLADVKRRVSRLEAEKTIISNGSITGDQLALGSIDGSLIVSGSITASQIQAGSITAALIQAGAINAGHIQANSITANEIAADAITAVELAAGSVVAGDITAGAVTAGTIAAGAVTASTVAADAIFTAAIQAGAVTAAKITVSTLSALTTNMGSLTAGTVTGATIQSGASGSRTVMDSLGFRGYALDGVTKTFEINTSSGIASFTGVATLDPSSVVPGGTLTGTINAGAIPMIGGGNQLRNSSFEDGINGWANSTNATLSSVSTAGTFRFGAKGLQHTAIGAGTSRVRNSISPVTDMPQARPGDSVVVSGYAKAATTARSVRVHIGWYDSTGTIIGTTIQGSTVTDSTTAWVRPTVTAIAPANTARVAVYGEVVSAAASEVHYWDDFQMEIGEVPTSYAPRADEILPGTITGSHIVDGSVGGTKITDGTVTDAKITAVGAAKVTGQLTNAQLADLAASKITGQLTDAQIAAIAAAKITGQITTTQITDSAISTPKLAAGSVTAATIAANTITANEIAADAITTSELAAGSVTTAKLVANAITANEIAADAVTAAKILAGSVTTAKIAAGAITANEVAAGAITANKLNVILGGGNFLSNSGFENTVSPTANWTYTGATAVGDVTIFKKGFGQQSVKLTSTVATSVYMTAPSNPADYTEVAVGKIYSASFWTRRGSTNTGTDTARAVIQWYDASDVLLAGTILGAAVTQSTSWQRCIATGAAPASAVKARLVAYASYVTSTIGNIYYMDDAQLEEGDVPTSYAPRTDEILPGTVVASMIAANTLTANEIAADAITTSELAANSVTAAKIVANTITASQIASATITATQMAANSITATQIAAGAVTANGILAGSIQTQHLSFFTGSQNMVVDAGFEYPITSPGPTWTNSTNASYSVATTTPRSGTQVGVLNIANAALTTATVTRSTAYRIPCTPSKVYSYSVWVRQVVAKANRRAYIQTTYRDAAGSPVGSTRTGPIVALPNDNTTWTQLTFTETSAGGATTNVSFMIRYDAGGTALFNADGQGTGAALHLDEAIMVPGEILPTTFDYKDGDIQPGSLGNTVIAPDAITTDKILAGTILGGDIAATTITGTNIAATTITAGNIASGTITATQLAAGSVTASKINLGPAPPNSPNVLPNSSFERRALAPGTGTGAPPVGWDATDSVSFGTPSVLLSSENRTDASHGSAVLVCAPTESLITGYTVSSEKVTVFPGETWTFSAYSRKQVGHTGNLTVSLVLKFFNSSGQALANNGTVDPFLDNESSGTSITSTTTFTRVSFTRTAPTGTVYATVELGSQTSIPSATGVEWDAAQFEKAASASSYQLRSIEQAMLGTEILPGSIYSGNIVANAIDGQLITGATIQTGKSWPKATFTTEGLALPSDSTPNPAVFNPTSIYWTDEGSNWSGRAYSFASNGAGIVEITARNVTPSGTGSEGGTVQIRTVDEASDNNVYTEGYFNHANGSDQGNIILTSRRPSDSTNYRTWMNLRQTGATSVIQFVRRNGNISTVGAAIEASAYNTYSDVQLKSSIKDSPVGLADTRKLKPKLYTLKNTEDDAEKLGLLAQDVHSVLPGLVTTSKVASEDDEVSLMSIDLGQLVALGVQTDIDLDSRIDALEKELAELKAKLVQ